MTARLLLAATMVVAGASAAATAEAQSSKFYGSVGYTSLEAGNVQLGGATGRVGYQFNSIFAVEGELTMGVKDDEITVAPARVSVELERALGVFGVAKLPLGDHIDLFGRLGVGQLTTNAGVSAGATGAAARAIVAGVETDDTGVAYGAGANLWFNKTNGIRVDYTRYQVGEDADLFGISYVHKF